jgi:hypothetical protein
VFVATSVNRKRAAVTIAPAILEKYPDLNEWCKRIDRATGTVWRYIRVNQADFDAKKPATVADLLSF